VRALALVFIGSGTGGVLRYCVGVAVLRCGGASALGTFMVNVIGTFVAVLLARWLGSHADHARAADVHKLVAIGVLGGFTTYSAFQVDVMLAVTGRSWLGAALILGGTVLACLAAGSVALAITR
jgi:CrcB protein